MPIYEHKRAVVCTIPALALKPSPTLAGILDDLEGQMGADSMKTRICNIMQQGNKAFLLHLASPDFVPEFIAHGYSFRGYQLKIDPVKSTTVVVLDRVPYGLPQEAITTAVAKYGTVSAFKAITHKGYGMSKFRLEIDLKQDIPSRISIQGNPINIFYKNQPRSCFVCREAGHEARNCPRKAGPARLPDPPTGAPSFAAVAAGAKAREAPVEVDKVPTDPPATKVPEQTLTVDEQPAMVVEKSAVAVTSAIVLPSEGEFVPPPPPPPPAPPALNVADPVSVVNKSIVPPAGEENSSLPSVEVSQESQQMDTNPPPVTDDPTSSSTAVAPIVFPSTQQLLGQFDNTPPSLKPRPSETLTQSNQSPSASGKETSSPLRSQRSALSKRKHPPAKRLGATIHGSGRKKTSPYAPTTGKRKKSPTVDRSTHLETIDEEY